MAQTAQLRTIEVAENEAQRIFKLQREAYLRDPYPSLKERRERLRALERILLDNTCVDGIRHSLKNLSKWMQPERRPISVLFATGSNRLVPQPKGVVGIVSPWNYPLFLTLSPLISVLAAGNRAMLKMASNSQTLCRLLQEKFSEVYAEDVVAILPGVPGREFSTLPFDHIIFTGGADAGRTVMRSASDSLTPVTLELGGKSPTIVCDDFDVDEAASWADLPGAGLPLLARGLAGPIRRCSRTHHARALSGHERWQLHVGHRRQVIPAPAEDTRGRGSQGRQARAARARCHLQRHDAQDPTASRSGCNGRHDDHAGGNLRTAVPSDDVSRPRRADRIRHQKGPAAGLLHIHP
ncbi:MAG: aldehyde dehydrogenase family protein [Deltaproteobacteria bacterium]|nr:aldehyde dehydrogenase family protein [Deltaproteobacteria bacterium]